MPDTVTEKLSDDENMSQDSEYVVDRDRIAEVLSEAAAEGAAAGWRPCSGCHETNEGAETGRYPYNKAFRCFVGAGCCECGGLGVVWEYWDKHTLDQMVHDIESAPPASPTITDEMVHAAIAAQQSAKAAYDGPFEAMRAALLAALGGKHD